MLSLYIHTDFTAEQQAFLSGHLPASVVPFFANQTNDAALQKAAFLQSAVVFGNVNPAWLEQHPNLEWLQLHSAGYNEYEGLAWKNVPLKQLQVTNLTGFFGQPVAETAVAGLLGLYRKIDYLAKLQTTKTWVGGALRPQMQLLFRKKILILGRGDIAQCTAQILAGFDCNVTLTGRDTSAETLNNALRDADAVISTLPENKDTLLFLNQSRLSLLKDSAVVVNVGRGSTLDEEALLKRLQAFPLSGAVLDVTHQEPLPNQNPLWNLPNVLLTQHTGGGYGLENMDKIEYFLENLDLFLNHKPLKGLLHF
jgi:glyoxylate/hydroxypyruvate reductase